MNRISAIAKYWWAFLLVSLVLPYIDTGDAVAIVTLLLALTAVIGFAIATTVLIRSRKFGWAVGGAVGFLFGAAIWLFAVPAAYLMADMEQQLDVTAPVDDFGHDIVVPDDMAVSDPLATYAPLPTASPGGGPDIVLGNLMQGGQYDLVAFINPGEAGTLFVKAFEATRDTPLSEDRIERASTQIAQWSSNAAELLAYRAPFTIYEGSWGIYYPARIEIWFRPASGGTPRKLLEKIFRVEGWMA